MRFLQQILEDEKKALSASDVGDLHIPCWSELGIRRVWQHAIRLRGFRDYLPDDWTSTRKTERKFFFQVLAYLAPGFVEALVVEARRLRNNHHLHQVNQPATLVISDRWADRLLADPYRSSKFSITTFHKISCFSRRAEQ